MAFLPGLILPTKRSMSAQTIVGNDLIESNAIQLFPIKMREYFLIPHCAQGTLLSIVEIRNLKLKIFLSLSGLHFIRMNKINI